MNRTRLVVIGTIVGLLLIAGPLLAVQRERTEPKELAKMLVDAKMTLNKAIDAAEKETKGTAIRAWAEKYPDGLRIDVHCVVGDQVKWAEVDQAGKVTMREMPTGPRQRPDNGGKPGEKKGGDEGNAPKKP